jgi:hypothetical protein
LTVAIRCRDYDQLRAALSARRRSLGLTQLAADERAGLQSGYVSTLEAGTKHLSKLSLPMLLAAYDLDLFVSPRSAVAPIADPTGSRGPVVPADRREAFNNGDPL